MMLGGGSLAVVYSYENRCKPGMLKALQVALIKPVPYLRGSVIVGGFY